MSEYYFCFFFCFSGLVLCFYPKSGFKQFWIFISPNGFYLVTQNSFLCFRDFQTFIPGSTSTQSLPDRSGNTEKRWVHFLCSLHVPLFWEFSNQNFGKIVNFFFKIHQVTYQTDGHTVRSILSQKFLRFGFCIFFYSHFCYFLILNICLLFFTVQWTQVLLWLQ